MKLHKRLAFILATATISLNIPTYANITSLNEMNNALPNSVNTGNLDVNINFDYKIDPEKWSGVLTITNENNAIVRVTVDPNGIYTETEGYDRAINTDVVFGLNNLTIAIPGLPAGENETYIVKLESPGYKTYVSDDITINKYNQLIEVHTGNNSFTAGDVNSDDVVTNKDIDIVIDALSEDKTQIETSHLDINHDGVINVLDLAYAYWGFNASEDNATISENGLSTQVVTVGTIIGDNSVTITGAKPADIIDVNNTSPLVLEAPSAIDRDNTISIPILINYNEQDVVKEVAISAPMNNAPTDGYILVEYADSSIEEVPFGQIEVPPVMAMSLNTKSETTIKTTIKPSGKVIKKITIVITKSNGDKIVAVTKIKLNVQTTTSAANNITIEDIITTPKQNSIDLTWNAIGNWDDLASTYKVSYGTKSGVYTSSILVGATNASITNLEPNTKYYIAVQAVDGDNEGAITEVGPYMLTTANTLEAPANLKVKTLDGSMKVTFDKVQGATAYNVTYVNTTGGNARSLVNIPYPEDGVILPEGGETPSYLEGAYKVSVVAIGSNDIQSAAAEKVVTIVRESVTPNAPTNLVASVEADGQIKLSFNTSKTTHTRAYYRPVGVEAFAFVEGTTESAVISDLNLTTEYEIHVVAYSNDLGSSPSKTITMYPNAIVITQILEDYIKDAITNIENVVVAESATYVPKGQKYVTSAEKTALENAIKAAEEALGSNSQTEIDKAQDALLQAIDKFEAAKKDGEFVGFASVVWLETQVTNANNAKSGIVEHNTGAAALEDGKKFVTSTDMKALTDAIASAQAMIDKYKNGADADVQDEIDIEATKLGEAINTFRASIKVGTKTANVTELENAIATANNAMAGVIITEELDVSNVPKGQKFTNQKQIDILKDAIKVAQDFIATAPTNAADVTAATNTLNKAITEFNNSIKTGTKVTTANTSELTKLIATAKTTKNSITTISENTSDVIKGTKFVTKGDMTALETTILRAENTVLNATEQSIVDTQVLELENAIIRFNTAIKVGTKVADISKLVSELENAHLAKATVVVINNKDEDEVIEDVKFVTQSEMTALETVMDEANEFIASEQPTSEQSKIDATVIKLQKAISKFKTDIKIGKLENSANISDLQSAIVDANNAKANILIAENATNVSIGKYFVTQATVSALDSVIQEAQNMIASAPSYSDSSDVVALTTKLNTAIETFNNSIKTGTKVADVSALNSAITTAKSEMTGVYVNNATSPSEVQNGVKYVSAVQMNTLRDIIYEAEALNKSNIAPERQAEINALKDKLIAATAAFKTNITIGSGTITEDGVNKEQLNKTITETKELITGVQIFNTTADKVDAGTKFVTEQAILDAIEDAIDQATKVYDNTNATQADINDALAILQVAVDEFSSKLMVGTKETKAPEFNLTQAVSDDKLSATITVTVTGEDAFDTNLNYSYSKDNTTTWSEWTTESTYKVEARGTYYVKVRDTEQNIAEAKSIEVTGIVTADEQAINAAKEAITATDAFDNLIQASHNTFTLAKQEVQKQVDAILENHEGVIGTVTATENADDFKAATAGTDGNTTDNNGTNGFIKFTVTLSKGDVAQPVTTDKLELPIIATYFDQGKTDQQLVDALIAAIEAATFEFSQVKATDIDKTKELIDAQIDTLPSSTVDRMSFTINCKASDFKGAIAGTSDNIEGTNGYLNFTVTATRGLAKLTTAITETTDSLKADIIAVEYSDKNWVEDAKKAIDDKTFDNLTQVYPTTDVDAEALAQAKAHIETEIDKLLKSIGANNSSGVSYKVNQTGFKAATEKIGTTASVNGYYKFTVTISRLGATDATSVEKTLPIVFDQVKADKARVDASVKLVQDATYSLNQVGANDEDHNDEAVVKTSIAAKITELLKDKDVSITVNKTEFVAATAGVAGDAAANLGTNGKYKFNVTITRGDSSETTTEEEATIVATPYTALDKVNKALAILNATPSPFKDIPQANADSEANAKKQIDEQIIALLDGIDVTCTVTTVTDGFKEATAGADGAPVGTDGSYTFNILIESGSESANVTNKKVIIVSTAFDQNEFDTEKVNTAIERIDALLTDFGLTQENHNTSELAKTAVQSKIDELVEDLDVTATITTEDGFTAAQTGTDANKGGTNGKYIFTLKVSRGEITKSIESKEATIDATDYVDTEAPTFDTPAVLLHDDKESATITVTVTGDDSDETGLQYSFDNGTTWQSEKIYTAIANGNYYVKVKDNAGNVAQNSTTVTISTIITAATKVENAKTAVANKTFTNLNQATYDNTETAAKLALQSQVDKLLTDTGVTGVVNTLTGGFKAATAGTSANKPGENGHYKFEVSLTRSGGSSGLTATDTSMEKEVIIAPIPYSDTLAPEFTVKHTLGPKDATSPNKKEVATITVTVTGDDAHNSVEYSIDDTKWQTGNTFIVTENKTYTIYVKDNSNHKGQKNHVINDIIIPDAYDVTEAKTAMTEKTFVIEQINASNATEAAAQIKAQIEALPEVSDKNITVVVTSVVDGFTAATAGADGDATANLGEDGTYKFTATLKKNEFSANTEEQTATIKATLFKQQEYNQTLVKEAQETILDYTTFKVNQVNASTEQAVKDAVKAIIEKRIDATDKKIEVTIETIGTGFTEADYGIPTDPDGTNGTYQFKVGLKRAVGGDDLAGTTTVEPTNALTATIVATPYTQGNNIAWKGGEADGSAFIDGNGTITTIPKGADNNPPYQLMQINYNRIDSYTSREIEITDSTGKRIWHDKSNANLLALEPGYWQWSYRDASEIFDENNSLAGATAEDLLTVERTNDTLLSVGDIVTISVAVTTSDDVLHKISGKYTITQSDFDKAIYQDADVVEPSFNPNSCSFDDTLDVTIIVPEHTIVYYTTDGSDPATNGIRAYTNLNGEARIDIDEDTIEELTDTVTIKAVALDKAGVKSDIVSAIYTKTTKEGLNGLIASVTKNKEDTPNREDGTGIYKEDKWANSAVHNALQAVIDAAQDVADNSSATAEQIQQAIDNLTAAETTFNEAKQYGLELIKWADTVFKVATANTDGNNNPYDILRINYKRADGVKSVVMTISDENKNKIWHSTNSKNVAENTNATASWALRDASSIMLYNNGTVDNLGNLIPNGLNYITRELDNDKYLLAPNKDVTITLVATGTDDRETTITNSYTTPSSVDNFKYSSNESANETAINAALAQLKEKDFTITPNATSIVEDVKTQAQDALAGIAVAKDINVNVLAKKRNSRATETYDVKILLNQGKVYTDIDEVVTGLIATNIITAFTDPEDISVTIGATTEQVNALLPTTLEATLSDETTVEVDVIWTLAGGKFDTSTSDTVLTYQSALDDDTYGLAEDLTLPSVTVNVKHITIEGVEVAITTTGDVADNTPNIGDTLTSTITLKNTGPGSQTPAVTYQWYRADAAVTAGANQTVAGTAIPNATTNSYQLVQEDKDKHIYIRVSSSNANTTAPTTFDSASMGPVVVASADQTKVDAAKAAIEKLGEYDYGLTYEHHTTEAEAKAAVLQKITLVANINEELIITVESIKDTPFKEAASWDEVPDYTTGEPGFYKFIVTIKKDGAVATVGTEADPIVATIIAPDKVVDTEQKLRDALASDKTEITIGNVNKPADIELTGDLTIPDGKTVIISKGSTLTAPDGITLTNSGKIVVNDETNFDYIASNIGGKIGLGSDVTLTKGLDFTKDTTLTGNKTLTLGTDPLTNDNDMTINIDGITIANYGECAIQSANTTKWNINNVTFIQDEAYNSKSAAIKMDGTATVKLTNSTITATEATKESNPNYAVLTSDLTKLTVSGNTDTNCLAQIAVTGGTNDVLYNWNKQYLISSVDDLAANVATQKILLDTNTGNQAEPNLPSTITGLDPAGNAVNINVTWTPNETFSDDAIKTFTYTGVATNNFALDSGITIPQITVNVVSERTVTTFEELKTAIDALGSTPGTIKLGANIDITEDITIPANIMLELSTFNLTNSTSVVTLNSAPTFIQFVEIIGGNIKLGSALTLPDDEVLNVKQDAAVSIYGGGYTLTTNTATNVFEITGNGNVLIDDVRITDSSDTSTIVNIATGYTGKVTLDSLIIDELGKAGINMNAGTLEMSSSQIADGEIGIVANSGTLNINTTTISNNTETGIEANGATVNINTGTTFSDNKLDVYSIGAVANLTVAEGVTADVLAQVSSTADITAALSKGFNVITNITTGTITDISVSADQELTIDTDNTITASGTITNNGTIIVDGTLTATSSTKILGSKAITGDGTYPAVIDRATIDIAAPIVGNTLTLSLEGKVSDSSGDLPDDTSVTYQWFRSEDNVIGSDTEITEATNKAYTLVEADKGKYIYASITSTNDGTIVINNKNSAMTQKVAASAEEQEILIVKAAIEQFIADGDLTFTQEATGNNAVTTEGLIEKAINKIVDDLETGEEPITGVDVAFNFEDGTFTAATTGTPGNKDGNNGSYTFTVTLSKDDITETIDGANATITATPYDPNSFIMWGDTDLSGSFEQVDIEDYKGIKFNYQHLTGYETREIEITNSSNQVIWHEKSNNPVELMSLESTSWDWSFRDASSNLGDDNTLSSDEKAIVNQQNATLLAVGDVVNVKITVGVGDDGSDSITGTYTITADDIANAQYMTTLNNALAAVDAATFTLSQADATYPVNTIEDAQKEIKRQVEALSGVTGKNLTATVTNKDFTAPKRGTQTETAGEDGSYSFTVSLTETGTTAPTVTTAIKSVAITAQAFTPELLEDYLKIISPSDLGIMTELLGDNANNTLGYKQAQIIAKIKDHAIKEAKLQIYLSNSHNLIWEETKDYTGKPLSDEDVVWLWSYRDASGWNNGIINDIDDSEFIKEIQNTNDTQLSASDTIDITVTITLDDEHDTTYYIEKTGAYDVTSDDIVASYYDDRIDSEAELRAAIKDAESATEPDRKIVTIAGSTSLSGGTEDEPDPLIIPKGVTVVIPSGCNIISSEYNMLINEGNIELQTLDNLQEMLTATAEGGTVTISELAFDETLTGDITIPEGAMLDIKTDILLDSYQLDNSANDNTSKGGIRVHTPTMFTSILAKAELVDDIYTLYSMIYVGSEIILTGNTTIPKGTHVHIEYGNDGLITFTDVLNMYLELANGAKLSGICYSNGYNRKELNNPFDPAEDTDYENDNKLYYEPNLPSLYGEPLWYPHGQIGQLSIKINLPALLDEELDATETELPELEMPGVEIPEIEIPDIEIPDIEIPDIEIPEVEILKVKASEEAKDVKLAEEAKDVKVTEEAKDVKVTEETKDIKVAEETKEVKVAKETKETKDVKVAEETKEVKVAKETKEVKVAEEAKDVKVTEEAKDVKVTEETKDIKVSEETKDVKVAKETKDIKVAEETKEVKVAEETKDVKVAEETKEVKVAEETKYVKVTEETKDVKVAEETKDVKVTEETKDVKVTEETKDVEVTEETKVVENKNTIVEMVENQLPKVVIPDLDIEIPEPDESEPLPDPIAEKFEVPGLAELVIALQTPDKEEIVEKSPKKGFINSVIGKLKNRWNI
ncbi:hypothetical protein AN641_02460 [Candidatus Epulonipiscioides gigas]|nr:hypothetical protein AN641_02460 [Epulopiscium sp. SCG-C07WGA-EpuloA2]